MTLQVVPMKSQHSSRVQGRYRGGCAKNNKFCSAAIPPPCLMLKVFSFCKTASERCWLNSTVNFTCCIELLLYIKSSGWYKDSVKTVLCNYETLTRIFFNSLLQHSSLLCKPSILSVNKNIFDIFIYFWYFCWTRMSVFNNSAKFWKSNAKIPIFLHMATKLGNDCGHCN